MNYDIVPIEGYKILHPNSPIYIDHHVFVLLTIIGTGMLIVILVGIVVWLFVRARSGRSFRGSKLISKSIGESDDRSTNTYLDRVFLSTIKYKNPWSLGPERVTIIQNEIKQINFIPKFIINDGHLTGVWSDQPLTDQIIHESHYDPNHIYLGSDLTLLPIYIRSRKKIWVSFI